MNCGAHSGRHVGMSQILGDVAGPSFVEKCPHVSLSLATQKFDDDEEEDDE